MFGFLTSKNASAAQVDALLRSEVKSLLEEALAGVRKLRDERDALKARVDELVAEVKRLRAPAPSEPGVVVDGTHTPQRVFIDGHEIHNAVSVTNSNEAGEVSRTTIVLHGTYSVRKRAVEPKLGEWIEWAGGECPVPGETGVVVKFRYGGSTENSHPARRWCWDHRGGDKYDIVAYRVVAGAGDTSSSGPHVPQPYPTWTNWNGGACPAPPGTKVDVKFRAEGQSAKNVEAEAFTWVHHGSAGDIVAYRIAQ